MIRFAPVLAMFALFAAACGADDATAETTFTVPVITEAPAGGSEDDGADADSVSDDEADADAGATEQDDGGGDSGQDDSGDDAEVDDPPEPLPSPDRTFGDLAEASIAVEVIASVPRITDAVVAPNGEFWVALWNGEVAVMDHRSGGIGATRVDISGETEGEGENGLLGIAVNDEALYLNYTDIAGDTHVDAWILDSEGLPGERREILFVDQPDWNHNGGGLEFGPDGYLYIGMGDGGGPGDPSDHGQNPNTLLGAILRIDPTPNADVPYAIPESNPYVDGGGAPEVFITGTRNPWRFSFDSQTGDLWVSDVGQDDWEELNLLLVENRIGLGQNLGWSLREGAHEYYGARPENNVDPLFEYHHEGDPGGCSITGGYVYRGDAIPELDGAYIFSDFCSARIWAVSIADGEVTFRDLGKAVPGGEPVTFAVDPDGELVMFSFDGPLSRLVPG